MNFSILPNDFDAPGCYRVYFPMRQLAQHDHTVKLPPYTSREHQDGTHTFTFDISESIKNHGSDIWFIQQRKERHWVESGGAVDQLRERGVCTVMDVDDNYLETPYWNPAWYGLHPYKTDEHHQIKESTSRIRNRAERRNMRVMIDGKPRRVHKETNAFNRELMHQAMRRVEAITVSTPYLANLYEHLNKNIHIVRNYLDWDIWEDVTPQYEVERERLRLAWFGAFRFRSGDLEVIKNVVPRVLHRHPNVDFVANTEAVHDFLGVPEGQRVTIGEYDFYPHGGGVYPVGEKTACADIGLAPLAPGGMAEGKSHLKGMEYNAAGMPFIASDTESYRYWCEEGMIGDTRNGFVADSESEWEERLEWFIDYDDNRRRMGKAGREKAEQHSIQNNWQEWEQTFEEIYGGEVRQAARGALKRGAVQKVSELEQLLQQAKDLNPKIIVEVGSARGGTFWALSQVSRPDALLVSVDMPSGSPLDVREGKDVYLGRDRERMRSYVREGQRCVLIDGNSQEESTLEKLIDVIGCEKIDVLFIDADHRYQGVKRDFELYSPLVREGGLIFFHDVIAQNDVRSGVHILWNQLCKKHRDRTETYVGKDNWGLGNWGGIGVLRA